MAILSVLLVVSLAASSHAQEKAKEKNEIEATDPAVTARVTKLIEALKDKDKNFKLTHAEFVTIKKGPQKTEQEQLFKKLDRDGNGHLTLSEFKNRNGIKGQ